MRFLLGTVPETPGFRPDAGWTPLREPTPWVLQLLALPIGLVACVSIGWSWILLTPLQELPLDSPVMALVILVAIIPVHELIHAAMHPQMGRTADSVLGFWPSRLLFYAHFFGAVSRNRFIAIGLMPLLVLSVVPLIGCAIMGWSSGVLALCSVLNALLACVDILETGMLFVQVPANALIRNQGWRTYWRISPPDRHRRTA